MNQLSNRWHKFWSEQDSSLHGDTSPSHLAMYGSELRLLFNSHDLPKMEVVELGCGDGALFESLGFETAKSYLGIDFSASLLRSFRKRFENAALIQADILSMQQGFCPPADLIFANGVAQYVSPAQMPALLEFCKSISKPGATIVLASIPWDALQSAYYSGVFFGQNRPWYYCMMASLAGRVYGRMGNWYNPAKMFSLGQRCGLSPQIFGSICYPYRFHGVFSADST